MGSFKTLQIAIGLTVILSGFSVWADALHDLKVDRSKLEAGGLCGNGTCMGKLEVPGASQLNRLLHKISIFEEDDRVIQARVGKDIGYAPIGGLVTNQPVKNPNYDPKDPSRGPKIFSQMEGSGELVSPCHVLTNYHVAFGGDQQPDPKNKKAVEKFAKSHSLNYYVGPKAGDLYEVKAHPVMWGQFMPKRSTADDWTLLELENCVGQDENIGWMEMNPNKTKDLPFMRLAQAGYPGDKDRSFLWMDPSCKSYGTEENGAVVLHDCAIRPGASGSTIFYLDENGVPNMVAMVSSEKRPKKGSAADQGLDADHDVLPEYRAASSYGNTAVGIAAIYDKISPLIEEAKRQYGKPNPVLARIQGERIKPVSATQPNPQKVPRKRNSGADI